MITTVATPKERKVNKRHQQMFAMYQRVGSQAEVARHFGVSREAVRQMLKKRFGIEVATRFVEKEERDKAIDRLIRKGMTPAEVAQELGIKDYLVASHLKKNPKLQAMVRARAEKRKQKDEETLIKLVSKIENGVTVMKAVKNDRAKAGRLRRLLRAKKIPIKSRSRWQDYSVREQIARDMLAQNKDWPEITRAINAAESALGLSPVTEGAVMAWCHARGLKNSPMPKRVKPTGPTYKDRMKVRNDKIHASYTSGVSVAELSARYRLRQGRIRAILKTYGVTFEGRRAAE